MVFPVSPSKKLTTPFNRYVFSFVAPYESQGRVIAKYGVKTKGFKRFGLLYQDDDFGNGILDGLKQQLPVYNLELIAAEKIAAHLPSAEMIRFACSGTDAVYNALRAARGYTGRNMVVRFNGHYDGGLDEIMGGIVLNPANPVPAHGELQEDIYSQITNTDGRARSAFNDCFMVEWRRRSRQFIQNV